MIRTIFVALISIVPFESIALTPTETLERDIRVSLAGSDVLNVIVVEEETSKDVSRIRYRVSFATDQRPRSIKRVDATATYVLQSDSWALISVEPTEVGHQFLDDTQVSSTHLRPAAPQMGR